MAELDPRPREVASDGHRRAQPRLSPAALAGHRQTAVRAARKALEQAGHLAEEARAASPLRFDTRGFPIRERLEPFEQRVRRWLGRL